MTTKTAKTNVMPLSAFTPLPGRLRTSKPACCARAAVDNSPHAEVAHATVFLPCTSCSGADDRILTKK
ncbi:MAG TPA: hypothetical protein DHU79_03840 [Clostridiales bacterium]|nr:hypothetical protein [Clostridiales bacterium]